MENYRHLSKEIERLRDWKKEYIHQKEILHNFSKKLQYRRRQLMSEIIYLYPIEKISEKKYLINGIYLPPSDNLSDSSDGALSVALGYISHILIMCASFLQVPLRYPLHHFGSRSVIEDHITASLSDKCREFPLYTRGKDRMQFNYAVYLINKNIAQFLYLLGARTPDLKATLPNILSLLQGKETSCKIAKLNDITSLSTVDTASVCSQDPIKFDAEHTPHGEFLKPFRPLGNMSDPILDCIRHECQVERSQSPMSNPKKVSRNKACDTGPGLSQILAIPEAYMNKQMSIKTFKHYMNSNNVSLENLIVQDVKEETPTAIKVDVDCDRKQEIVEEAKEMIPNENVRTINEPKVIHINNGANKKHNPLSKRLSRSVGSYTDEDISLEHHTSLEVGSDPLLNISSDTNNSALKNYSIDNLTGVNEVSQQEFLQKWLDSGPSLICSEENLYPDEILGSAAQSSSTNSPLTLRTDALLQTKSFNLIKPKF